MSYLDPKRKNKLPCRLCLEVLGHFVRYLWGPGRVLHYALVRVSVVVSPEGHDLSVYLVVLSRAHVGPGGLAVC